MIGFLPSSRPRLSRAKALARLPVEVDSALVTVAGIRGYYHDEASSNQRGIYDDAIVIIGPEHFSTYNANADPSVFRPGIANLMRGVYSYKKGIHGLSRPKAQQYQAYVQAGPVSVMRDGSGKDVGWFGINIHRGGHNTTSSLGCQTIHPSQWEAFRAALNDQLARTGQKTFQYILV